MDMDWFGGVLTSLFQREGQPVKQLDEVEEGEEGEGDCPLYMLLEMFPNLDTEVLDDLWQTLNDVDACIEAALQLSGMEGTRPTLQGKGGKRTRRRRRHERVMDPALDEPPRLDRLEVDGAAALFTTPLLPLPLKVLSSSTPSSFSASDPPGESGPSSNTPSTSVESAPSGETGRAEERRSAEASQCPDECGPPSGPIAPPPSGSLGHVGTRRRGNPCFLPRDFLRIPRCLVSRAPVPPVDKPLTVRTSYSARLSKLKGVRGGLGVTVEEMGGKIVVRALPRDQWDQPNQAERAGVCVGDILEGIEDVDFGREAVCLEWLIQLVRSLPTDVTLHLVHVDTVRGLGHHHNHTPGEVQCLSPPPRPLPFSPASLIPTSYHRLAKLLLEEGVADHEQAYALTKMMLQVAQRERMWDDDSFVSLPLPLQRHSPTRLSLVRRRSESSGDLRPTQSCGSEYRPSPGRRPCTSVDSGLDSSPSSCPSVSPLALSTQSLRRALLIRIVATDFIDDHTIYVLDVTDVASRANWRVRRRFREFFELQERCVALRPSIAKLDFPMRRPTLTESINVVHTRKVMLTKYLRRLAGLPFYAPLHRSSCATLRLLQDFLDVPSRLEALHLLDQRAKNGPQALAARLEIAVHRVLNMPVLDKILTDFTDHLAAGGAEEDLFGLSRTGQGGGMSGQDMLEHLRRFMDHLQACVMDGCGDELRALVSQARPAMCHDDADALILASIRRQVEAHVSLPVMARLIAALRRDDQDTRHEVTVRDNMHRAKELPQSFFGIPPHQCSPSRWAPAVCLFNAVVSPPLPCDKLSCLVEAAKAIPRLYASEHPEVDAPLGADEFLPIFIYVVSQSAIEDLYLLKHVLCMLVDPSKRLSEAGYYLASFEAAVEHLHHLPLTEEADK